MSSQSLRVAVVDDDQASREAVRLVLAGSRFVTVPFPSARDALEAARAGRLPPLVLMDMSLPGESAGRAIAEILRLRPETQIAVLSSHQRDDYVFEALRDDRRRILEKTDHVPRLRTSIGRPPAGRRVTAGSGRTSAPATQSTMKR